MIRLRRFHLRASRCGGQVAASARKARLPNWVGSARHAAMTAALVGIAGTTSLLACPMCFGAEETAMIDGAKLGVLVMLGITLSVQGAIVGFFVYLRKRAKRIAELELDTESPEIQRAGTS